MDFIQETLLPVFQQEQRARKQMAQENDWNRLARESQKVPPGDWLIWLILAGRGFGKTRTGAQTIHMWAHSGYKRMALIGNTQAEVRQVMVEGESGLLRTSQSSTPTFFEPTKRQIKWPNGALAHTFSAENVEQLRGPQFDAAWIDEFAKFPNPDKVLDQLMFGLRLGKRPRIIITTTPRPHAIIKSLCKRSDCVVTRGSTYDNASNLSVPYLKTLSEKYGTSALGRQEVYGQIVEEATALWRVDDIQYVSASHQQNYAPGHARKHLVRIVLGLDPAMTSHESSDETGIIIAGIDDEGACYVLADASMRAPVDQWACYVAQLAKQWQVDCVVGEVNQGGDLVKSLLKSAQLPCPFVSVRASTKKAMRALPVALRYGQHRVYHLQPFHQLEEQMLGFSEGAGPSPDRVDALVWALQYLCDHPTPAYRMW